MPPPVRSGASLICCLIGLALNPVALSAQGPPSGATRVMVKPDTVYFQAAGSGTLPSRTVRIQRVGPPAAGVTFTAAVATTSGGNWLGASPLSGPIPNTLILTANPGTLGPGTYNGRVTVTTAGGVASTHVVNVVLRILSGPGGAPAAFVRPASLEFRMVQGGANPAARALTISSPTGGASFSWTATRTITTPAGGNWFQIAPTSGTGTGTITVTVNGSGLAAGRYSGTITVASGSVSSQVPVTLDVTATAAAGLAIHPRAFNFIVHPGGSAPAPKSLTVENKGSGSLSWTAVATSAPNWLSITPTAGSAPANIRLTANAAGLARGHYEGSVRVTAGGETQTARVFLRLVGPPGGGPGGGGGGGAGTPAPSVNPAAVQIVPPSVAFTGSGGTTTPTSVAVRLSSTVSGLTFTAAPSTSRGGNWLSITPPSGAIPATIAVSASVTGLAPGLYTGAITVNIAGAIREQRTIPVSLEVSATTQQPARLRVQPTSVLFRATRGGANPAPVQVALEAGGAVVNYQAERTPATGTSWLTVSPASGATPVNVTLSANVTGLAVGNYNASVVFSATGNTSVMPVTLLVTLVVSAGTGSSGESSFSFAQSASEPEPADGLQGLFLRPEPEFFATANLPLEVRVLVVDEAGQPIEGAEVRVASSNGEPEFILEDVGGGEYTGLFRGLRAGPVALTATASRGEAGSPVFGVGGDLDGGSEIIPVIYQEGAVSAASFAAGAMPLAPGAIVSLFGQDLVPATEGATSLPLPKQLAGVRVLVGGLEAPLLAVVASAAGGSDQINFQVPAELSGFTYADVVVENNGFYSAPQAILLVPALPAVFTRSQDGRGTAAALHADFAPVAAQSPARPGETILLFATGLGEVSPAQVTGEAARGEARVTGQVRVSIGGRSATVPFAGLAPGFAGLYQINVVLPEGIAPGDAPLEISVDGIGSGEGVTLPIR